MATVSPEWFTLGQRGAISQTSHDASPETSAQALHYVGEYRRRAPQGIFKESDDFSAIIKAIVDGTSWRVSKTAALTWDESAQ